MKSFCMSAVRIFAIYLSIFLILQRDLVEETISYIAYLEGILQMANEKVCFVCIVLWIKLATTKL